MVYNRCQTSDAVRRNPYNRQMKVMPQTHRMPSNTECCENRKSCDVLSGMPLAMAYVPWQEWRNLYETEKGFHRGTIFAELDKPFLGMGGCCNGK